MTQLSDSYPALLAELKERILNARLRAAVTVNRDLVLLYWTIGRDILARQRSAGWGAKVIARLAADLRRAFPEMSGMSSRNLKYMRAFAQAWPEERFVQQVVAQLPWGHNTHLLDAVKSSVEREWYARQAVNHGWSRSVLLHQIETGLFVRQGNALTNFTRTLPVAQSELAQQLIKDPYTFDFLALGPRMLERDLQRGLIEHLRSLILELGKGFAFVGSQYRIEVGGQDYFIDLLFYHLRLRCFVAFDLKIDGFKPEFAGKMNFYFGYRSAAAPFGRSTLDWHHSVQGTERDRSGIRAARLRQADGRGTVSSPTSIARAIETGAADSRGTGAGVSHDGLHRTSAQSGLHTTRFRCRP